MVVAMCRPNMQSDLIFYIISFAFTFALPHQEDRFKLFACNLLYTHEYSQTMIFIHSDQIRFEWFVFLHSTNAALCQGNVKLEWEKKRVNFTIAIPSAKYKPFTNTIIQALNVGNLVFTACNWMNHGSDLSCIKRNPLKLSGEPGSAWCQELSQQGSAWSHYLMWASFFLADTRLDQTGASVWNLTWLVLFFMQDRGRIRGDVPAAQSGVFIS